METILQFGSGRFLRGFVDLFVHHGNTAGQCAESIAIVQSTGAERAAGLNRQGGRYHVAIRGIEGGAAVDRVEECRSVSRALHAPTQWAEVLALAAAPHLAAVISNATEAGYEIDPEERWDCPVPRSFPAKLLAVLYARWQAGLPGLSVIPCELIEGNAGRLRALLLELIGRWRLPPDFSRFIQEACTFQHTLVDRIVVGPPPGHPLAAADPMLIAAEPFAFFALESDPRSAFRLEHPAIVRTPDVAPYFLRKVRILNAAHTALAPLALARGFAIVRDAVNDAELGGWLRRLLFKEIVPVLHGRVEQPEWFAEQTLERFRNPFIDHKLRDITLHHAAKMAVRLEPTRREHVEQFGAEPPLLGEALRAGAAMLTGT